MPIPPIEVIQKIMFVINCLVEEDLPQLDQLVTINGHLNDNGIQQLENILLQTGRDDVLEILHETLAGNYNLLEMNERRFLRILHQFYGNRNHAGREWPAWCYRFTNNINPVRDETSELNRPGVQNNESCKVCRLGGTNKEL